MAIVLKISKIRRYKTSKNPRKFKIHRDKLSLFYKGYIAKRRGEQKKFKKAILDVFNCQN
jgi:hypothetical protein